MARAVTPQVKARRSLVGLVLIVLALLALNFLGVLFAPGATFGAKMQSFVPKLGLDLQGGTQIILQAQTISGQNPTTDQLNQSVAIIRQRVDAGGVSEAQISTAGGKNIIVSLPGTPSQATINSVKSSARMVFRSVLLSSAASTTSVGKTKPYTPPASLATQPTAKPTNGSDASYITPYLQDLYDHYDCGQDTTAAKQSLEHPTDPLVTCNPTGTEKYLLGPVEVEGTHISNATSGVLTTSQGATTGSWAVNLTLDPTGSKEFATTSSRLVALTAPKNEFAIVLDGKVIEAPAVNQAITNGQAADHGQLHPGLREDPRRPAEVRRPADQLQGAEPGHHLGDARHHAAAERPARRPDRPGPRRRSTRCFSTALLGLRDDRIPRSSRGLLTYLVIDFLSWHERLPAVARRRRGPDRGDRYHRRLVHRLLRANPRRVARGQGAASAPSRPGGGARSARSSPPMRSTSSPPSVLYILAVGDVRGFALTLGLTTIIDVVIVALFTHPMLQLVARRRFFADGHRFSGLDPRALGAVYRGRAQLPEPALARAAPCCAAAARPCAGRPSPSARPQSSRAPPAPARSTRSTRSARTRTDGAASPSFGNDLYTGARSIDFVGQRRDLST